MLKPINQIAHGIGMQNQYLYGYIKDGIVKGDVDAWDYWSKTRTDKAMLFLQHILNESI